VCLFDSEKEYSIMKDFYIRGQPNTRARRLGYTWCSSVLLLLKA
jgi:hypothetical protein